MASFMQPWRILLTLVALAMSTTMVLSRSSAFHPPTHNKVTTATPSSSPPPPPPTHHSHSKINRTEEFLNAHNRARSSVGAPPLKWSKQLAMDTNKLVRYQRDKKGCKFAEMRMTKYGMNQLWASGMAVTPRAAVESWVEKKKYYNHANNTCAPHHTCGVYKQVVWKKSLELGCAQVSCVKEHVTLTICLYSPPGNVIGQKPY